MFAYLMRLSSGEGALLRVWMGFSAYLFMALFLLTTFFLHNILPTTDFSPDWTTDQ